MTSTVTRAKIWPFAVTNHHHHHHLALQPFVGFRLLSQVSPSSSILSCLLPVFYFQLYFSSSMTSSCHRCLGLPTGLVPAGLQSNSFLVGRAWSILWICPSHLILCALMNLTISAPSIKLSISMLFPILHILSILTGPNIFLSICLSGMRRLFSSLLLKSKSPMNTWPLVLSSFYVGIILCTTNIRARSSACECFRCKYHSS